ncbi:MAG: hypothetical protein CL912_18370 [Deltaproteobacteria bacterium]|nr:hypothetical protein [Deltaproteobacteria bacterium]
MKLNAEAGERIRITLPGTRIDRAGKLSQMLVEHIPNDLEAFLTSPFVCPLSLYYSCLRLPEEWGVAEVSFVSLFWKSVLCYSCLRLQHQRMSASLSIVVYFRNHGTSEDIELHLSQYASLVSILLSMSA